MPEQVTFQGIVVPIASHIRAQPVEDIESSKKASEPVKDEARRRKIGRKTKETESDANDVQMLESTMIELELGSDSSIDNDKATPSDTSEFNIAIWSRVDWKKSLSL